MGKRDVKKLETRFLCSYNPRVQTSLIATGRVQVSHLFQIEPPPSQNYEPKSQNEVLRLLQLAKKWWDKSRDIFFQFFVTFDQSCFCLSEFIGNLQ